MFDYQRWAFCILSLLCLHDINVEIKVEVYITLIFWSFKCNFKFEFEDDLKKQSETYGSVLARLCVNSELSHKLLIKLTQYEQNIKISAVWNYKAYRPFKVQFLVDERQLEKVIILLLHLNSFWNILKKVPKSLFRTTRSR